MNYFDCYICLEKIAEVYSQQPCESPKHLCCTICYQKIQNKTVCPMCRQKNPLWVEPISESESEDDSDENDNEIINFIVDREAIQRILGNEQLLQIQSRLALLFLESEQQNLGHNAGWII